MKNKNNVVLTIIAIATILVTVVGATFAYFASTVDEGTGSNFTAVVEEDNVLFTATGSNMTMEVTADKMTEHASSGGVIEAGSSSDSLMNVTLSVGSENPIACYYNIYFQWDSTSTAYLTKTTGADKEFTAQLEFTDNNGTGSSGTNKFVNETQLTDVVTTTNKTLVVENAYIVASSSSSGAQIWSPTIRFYNLQLDQTNLAGKTFKGKFTIDDVECGAYQPTLSESIIAKVSDSDYTSSQDASPYKIKSFPSVALADNSLYSIQKNYGDINMYTASTINAINGTPISNAFTMSSDGIWSNNLDVMTSDATYALVLPISEDGYYNFCYEITESNKNYLNVYVTDSSNSMVGTEYNLFYGAETYFPKCINLNYLNIGQAVRVVYGKYSDATLNFNLKSTSKEYDLDVGIRFVGKDPDNYLTFNGEAAGWRIIGVFEGSTIGLEEGKQYTKIIRNEGIPGIEWNETDSNDWASSSLKKHLNSNYYNGIPFDYRTWEEIQDGENYYLQESIKHMEKVIDDKNRPMIAKANWYLGANPSSYGVLSDPYSYLRIERGNVGAFSNPDLIFVNDYIGLFYVSDVLFAKYTSNADNWFFVQHNADNLYPLSIVPLADSSGVLMIDGDFSVVGSIPMAQYPILPTLYLEANLTATGSGSKSDPYVLN